MLRRRRLCLLSISVVVLAAGEQPWKDKQISEWSEADARQVLTDSPWAKQVTPKFKQPSGSSRGGMNRGGIGAGGIGIGGLGIPGIGGRRGGMGGRGGGPWGGPDAGGGRESTPTLPTLTVRWESAMPVQAAELKAREVNAPSIDEAHYALVVVGVPGRMAGSDSQGFGGGPKPQAELKRSGKKAIRSSEAKVLPRDEGTIVVFFFPRSQEISGKDREVEFDAHIGPLELDQTFVLSDMTYDGKLEL
jgi:hypothetical protein